MSDEQLITRYRPTKWSHVVGQKEVVASLRLAIEKGLSHVLLFTGNSGTGKTTLARIALNTIGCNESDILEYDAATLSSVDDIRNLKTTLQYRPLGGRIKGIIVDECHGLSRQGWDALLKEIEEAREYLYWCFCTTEPARIRDTIRTRCTAYNLKAVSVDEIIDLLDYISEEEKFTCNREVLALCAREARGSPRQAIAFLSVCANVQSREEASRLIRAADDQTEAFQLAQALGRGADWDQIRPILNSLAETNPESIRHVIRAYMTKAMLGARTGKEAVRFFDVLDAFSQPFNSGDGLSPVLHAIGKIIFVRS